jgi:predicted DNA-binding transcriptional regulator AlpA
MHKKDTVNIANERDPLLHLDGSISSHRLLSSRQTAALLNCSTVHLRRLAQSGKIPKPLRIGGRKLAWRASEIKTLLSI